MLESFAHGGTAVVIGASGGIGQALVRKIALSGRFGSVLGFSRSGELPLDITKEETIRQAALHLADLAPPTLMIVATGVLHQHGMEPEKTYTAIDAQNMANAFAVNTIGPALVMKHILPLLPKREKAVFAVLSAKVGSISDNRLGGWYSYRSSKAALNQMVHTAAIELRRHRPEAVCLALHPGTVATNLSEKFAKTGLHVQTPDAAAEALLTCMDLVDTAKSGTFLDRDGQELPW